MKIPEDIQEVFDKATCLYTRKEVEMAFDQLASEIHKKLADTNPVFICIVVGGIIPMGNLLPRLDFPLQVDYIHATRYGNDIVGKSLEWKVKPSTSLEGRTVVVVDDILDGGLTMQAAIDYCKEQKAKEIYSVVLVDKQSARQKGCVEHADFTGLEVENHYLFGFGMDYKNYLRNAPGIYQVAPEYEE